MFLFIAPAILSRVVRLSSVLTYLIASVSDLAVLQCKTMTT